MLTIKDSYFDPSDKEEARQERLAESVFIRDVIKTICKDTLAKARKSNQCYNNLSRTMLESIGKSIENDQIRSVHYYYSKESLLKK